MCLEAKTKQYKSSVLSRNCAKDEESQNNNYFTKAEFPHDPESLEALLTSLLL